MNIWRFECFEPPCCGDIGASTRIQCQENGPARYSKYTSADNESSSEPITFALTRFSPEEGKEAQLSSTQLSFALIHSAFLPFSIPPIKLYFPTPESPLLLPYVSQKKRQWFQVFSRSRGYDDSMSRRSIWYLRNIYSRSYFAA